MGMMGRLSERDRKLFKKAVKAVVKKDVNDLITVIMTMGVCKGNINYSNLYEDVDNMLQRYTSMDMGDVDLAVFLDEIMVLMSNYNVKVPKGLSMLARGIMTIEGVLAEVSPSVNVITVASDMLKEETFAEYDVQKEISKTLSTMYGSGSKALNIPSLAADLLENTVKGHTKVKLDLAGTEEFMKQLSKMVNKIVVGLIASSLLIGSSMLCTTKMTPSVLGIPALGFLGFLVAVLMGLWLIIDVKKNR
jgi:ubiquinone biosynthesis protein